MTDPDDDGDVTIKPLAECWADSTGSPLAIVETDEPLQAGSYVLEPGERVPETGTTSHDGTEVSVILSGSVVLGGPSINHEQTVKPNTLVTIPRGVEHYSRNDGSEPVKLVYVVAAQL